MWPDRCQVDKLLKLAPSTLDAAIRDTDLPTSESWNGWR